MGEMGEILDLRSPGRVRQLVRPTADDSVRSLHEDPALGLGDALADALADALVDSALLAGVLLTGVLLADGLLADVLLADVLPGVVLGGVHSACHSAERVDLALLFGQAGVHLAGHSVELVDQPLLFERAGAQHRRGLGVVLRRPW